MTQIPDYLNRGQRNSLATCILSGADLIRASGKPTAEDIAAVSARAAAIATALRNNPLPDDFYDRLMDDNGRREAAEFAAVLARSAKLDRPALRLVDTTDTEGGAA